MIPTRDRILATLADVIHQHGSIGLFPHVGADGDALGSAIGFAMALNQAGAHARVFTDEPVSERLQFIPALDHVTVHRDLTEQNWPEQLDLAFAIDCTEPERLGCRQGLYLEAKQQAALDHHVSSGESGGLKMIDPAAAATGEVVLDIIRALETERGLTLLNRESAMALMTAIVSDTGGFVYSNTTARSFAAAAQLMAYGPDLRLITYRLFDETSKTRLRLTGRLFSQAEFLSDNRLVYAFADQELLKSLEATDSDLEGIIAELRKVSGVEVAFLFRELSDGSIRVNIRSNDYFHAAQFAAAYGGGGHAKAAGMTIRHLSLKEAVAQVVDQAQKGLEYSLEPIARSEEHRYFAAPNPEKP